MINVSCDIKNDKTDELKSELRDGVSVALEKVGLVAEGYAKRLCPVDTGLLRNSITHALGGQEAAISEYHDRKNKQHGMYAGVTPEEPEGSAAVYIGTNVEYAPYVEMGTIKTVAQPFIRPAILDHLDKYKRIIKSTLNDTEL